MWIGYKAPSDGAMHVWIAPVSDPSKARAVTRKGQPVGSYRWTYLPGRLLYTTAAENGTHVFLLDLAGGEPRDLTQGEGSVASIERLVPDRPDEVLLRVSAEFRKVNLRTGASQVVFTNDEGFDRVLFDDSYRPRVAERGNPDGGYDLLQQDGAGSWTSFASFLLGVEADASRPIALDKEGQTLYLADNRGRDTAALEAIDLASGKETVLLEDPLADVVPALVLHPRTGRVQSAVSYYGRMRRHFLDPSIVPDFEYLRTVARGDIGVPSIGGRSLDDTTWIVVFLDGGTTRYYLYDRAARRARALFSELGTLDKYTVGRRHLEVITTRDGMNLPADLYLPASADPDDNGRPREPLPLLLYVHGGPWGAYPWNSWFTNRVLQLLADRGYAVLRVEFRGTGGLGRKVQEAGLRDWGGKMQDDIMDAADWAVAQRITTRDRIGIWGWSYGAYATLAALTQTPERFACGMAMYGPTELDSFIDEGSAGAQTAWRHYIGDNTTEKGRALLRERSPIRHVERISKPLLIAQGGKDEIVRQGQADRFVEAMRKSRKPVTYVLYPDEPHDLRLPESWASLFAIAERFFHEHLGGRFEPIGDDLEGGFEVRAGAELIPGLAAAMGRRPVDEPSPMVL
jgi:dipeptidyl aminopeptidase/acylaminoacyl peptidase